MATYYAVVLTVIVLSTSLCPLQLMAAEMTGVMMKDGKMMLMKDGKATGPMDHEMTLSDGTMVMTDGMVKKRDGKEIPMKDGQMLLMDGKMLQGGKAREMQK